MKTLDVQALHKAIDQTLEQLKHQSDEIAKVQKSVEEIASLDDALKGKGGDAIRAFYEECHTPFLQFYDTFIGEYSSTLKKMKSALNSLEPNHNGFISQNFLEHELEQGVNAADRTTKHLVSKTNATIAKVSHIVDLPDLNDSGFHEQNQKALKEISTTLEKLHTFDREQTNALKTAENDLETMQRYISRLEKMYTGPKIEITGYQKGSILKPDEMDTLRGGQDTAMGVMLDKLDKRSKLEKEVSEVSKQDNKVSKLKKKLDDFNFSTASEFYEMAVEIGYENLSPWQQRYFNQIEGARDFGNAIKGSAEGLKNAVVDTAVGLWDMVVHADETIEGINFTLHHPDVTFNIIKKGIEDSYQRDVVNGDSYTQARWFSYAVGMVGTSIVGSKGVDKAAKAAKAGKVGQVAAKATKASKKVSKQALEKSVASFKKSMQRVASNIKGIQIHNPFAPQVQFAGGGKLPYNAIEGSNFKEELIRRIKELANVEKGDIGINKATSEKVVNALSNFKSRKMTFGNRRFLLDKKGMKHILERHHPKYWDGSVKATQSFFKKDLSTEDIANAIESILKQNRGVLTEKDFRGTTGKQQITGTYNGVKYVVGFKKGRIGQFYPVE
ncbi:T7SS effector LXG polymorphic toxin [Bacillus paralicheniformis]|nr:T7SS effector LXG polymorphic toxin [Bacillus paralicheniformis]MDE1360597.1 T7SS effector LXG polymorphic toxin [Bacillus paralicheniformis]MDR9799540.1 T7SS effector LXG polymorphic toxin [Bacillus paralicheniformis]MEC2097533.1 T7SS effector LXG polymorphic toxin [Bacillus paralicheniformis]MEC2116231.1 T7SS effector LXG polymorphic toxin [Bacillus paralicheniformis]MEC2322655.1 T7SS effector LXG polymorphic toxin [Bacillus paralicheniformis]